MALSDCSCQLVWTTNLLSEISFDVPIPHLYGDNLGSLFWSTNPVQEKRSKYIDGAKNPADILTKNLGQVLFHQFCLLLSLEIL